MCLAIPGKVLQIEEQDGLRLGRVQFGGMGVLEEELAASSEGSPSD